MIESPKWLADKGGRVFDVPYSEIYGEDEDDGAHFRSLVLEDLFETRRQNLLIRLWEERVARRRILTSPSRWARCSAQRRRRFGMG